MKVSINKSFSYVYHIITILSPRLDNVDVDKFLLSDCSKTAVLLHSHSTKVLNKNMQMLALIIFFLFFGFWNTRPKVTYMCSYLLHWKIVARNVMFIFTCDKLMHFSSCFWNPWLGHIVTSRKIQLQGQNKFWVVYSDKTQTMQEIHVNVKLQQN